MKTKTKSLQYVHIIQSAFKRFEFDFTVLLCELQAVYEFEVGETGTIMYHNVRDCYKP